MNTNAVPIDDDTSYTTTVESSSDDEISSGSSVDTDDLDFSYQEKNLDDPISSEDELADEIWVSRKKKLDLVSEDIFSDYTDDTSDYDTDGSDVITEVPLQPIPTVITRQ